MADQKTPPDARTVNPGQAVTYHQTESRPVKVAWAQPAGTEAWRRAAIRSVLQEHGLVGPGGMAEQDLEHLTASLMMRLDRPEGDDAERRITKLEAYVSELRGNRDVHAKVIAELAGNPGAQLRFGPQQPTPAADTVTRVSALEAWKARLAVALGTTVVNRVRCWVCSDRRKSYASRQTEYRRARERGG